MRGRSLHCPGGPGVRPVLGRLRESIFSLLGRLDGLVVLDLFAGVGTLGLEAVSRGALRATFVERNPAALASLRRNLASLGVEERSTVVAGDVHRFLRGRMEPFDVTFADPPYDRGEITPTMGALSEWPGASSLFVIKHSVREDAGEQWRGFVRIRVLGRGDDRVHILRGGECGETGDLSRDL